MRCQLEDESFLGTTDEAWIAKTKTREDLEGSV